MTHHVALRCILHTSHCVIPQEGKGRRLSYHTPCGLDNIAERKPKTATRKKSEKWLDLLELEIKEGDQNGFPTVLLGRMQYNPGIPISR